MYLDMRLDLYMYEGRSGLPKCQKGRLCQALGVFLGCSGMTKNSGFFLRGHPIPYRLENHRTPKKVLNMLRFRV